VAFVVSSGSLQSVERPAPRPAYAMQIASNLSKDYAALWRAQPELRTVIDFLARNIAQLGLHVFRRVSDVDRERLTEHPLAALLGQPNLSTTRYRLVDALVHDLCIFDFAVWVKVRAESGQPVGLRRIPPPQVTPIGSDWLEAEKYEIRGSKGKLEVPADAVVCFRGYNPSDARTGASPIESLRQILAEEWAANIYREQLWRNGARVSGYIKRPEEAPDWGPNGRERFRSQFQAHYAGEGPQAGGTPILEDGMEFVPASTSPRDAQYIESRKLTREEVARSYHVPLPMVGILDHATFSNIREQHKQLYQDCLGPWLEMIQQEIELQLLPDLPDTDGVYVEFNINEKLRGSFEEQAQQLQASVGAPYMTRNEARARLNLPQVDGGDDLVVPLNVLIAGGGVAPDVTEPDDSGSPKRAPVRTKARTPQPVVDSTVERLAKFFTRQGKVIASRLGAKAWGRKATPDEVFDEDRWNGELAADLLAVNLAIAGAAASATFGDIGGGDDFDEAIMAGWLAANAEGVAKVVNTVTKGHLGAALDADSPLDAVRKLFDTYVSQRAPQLAATQTAGISGFGSVEAAKHRGGSGAMKTWVTGSNPRKSHARMDGETVGLDERFSNGARWPADSNLDVDDVAGCNCHVVITIP
jgi:HK97 family phage portal protein